MRNILRLLIYVLLAGSISAQAQSSRLPKAPTGYAFTPAGVFPHSDPPFEMPDYYMATKPVTNAQYAEFLNELKQHNRINDLKIAKPSTYGWQAIQKKNAEEYMKDLNRPIMNISLEACQLYCQWLSEKMNRKDTGYTYHFQVPTLRHMQYYQTKLPEAEAKTTFLFNMRFSDVGSSDASLNMQFRPILFVTKK